MTKLMKARGFLTLKAMAEYYGVPYVTVRKAQEHNRVPLALEAVWDLTFTKKGRTRRVEQRFLT